MGFLSPNDIESKPLLRNNNLKTLWSKLFNLSAACLGNNKKKKTKLTNNSLSTFEIKRRMVGIPVHIISNHAQCSLILTSDDRSLEMYYISKSDAQDFLDAGTITLDNDVFDVPATCRIIDAPLSHVVEDCDSLKLVPELSQVKNAIELINKDGKEKAEDLSFSGVPVFQSKCIKFTVDETGVTYSPAFLRKEDLENLMDIIVKPEDRDDIIKVSAFEDIIQKMKDDSTSEANDIFFVGPGITSWTWFQT